MDTCLCALCVFCSRSIICWDLRTEKRVSTHLQRMGGVHRVQLSGDETLVMTVGQEKRLTCWDLREHHPITYRDLSSKGNDESHSLAVSQTATAQLYPTLAQPPMPSLLMMSA